MLAPRRTPPCFSTSVACHRHGIKDPGPEGQSLVDPTTSPAGRSLEKLNPVPPPRLLNAAPRA